MAVNILQFGVSSLEVFQLGVSILEILEMSVMLAGRLNDELVKFPQPLFHMASVDLSLLPVPFQASVDPVQADQELLVIALKGIECPGVPVCHLANLPLKSVKLFSAPVRCRSCEFFSFWKYT